MEHTSYSVSGNKLIVRRGGRKTCIPIYIWECGRLVLSKQFSIINLYLNMPVVGTILPAYPRNIPEGSEYTSHYISTGLVPNINGTCYYMTFKSLSKVDEAHTLSRIVEPRRELFQLYQKDYDYEIKYKIRNKYGCNALVEFLIPNFSQEPESGAAYPTIDVRGEVVEPICVRGGCNVSGSFMINGWQFLMIVKSSIDVDIILTISAVEKTTYPPFNELVLPVKTDLGTVDVLVYTVPFIDGSSIREVTDEFRGINSVVRGYHFSYPNFPCFGSTNNIIDPPPYSQGTISKLQQDIVVTVTSSNIYPFSNFTQEGIFYAFSAGSVNPPNSFITLANEVGTDEYLAVNLFTTGSFNFLVEVTGTIDISPVPGKSAEIFKNIYFGICGRYHSQYQATCLCSAPCSQEIKVAQFIEVLPVTVSINQTFKFNNKLNRAFNINLILEDSPEVFFNPENYNLTLKFTVLTDEPLCDNN